MDPFKVTRLVYDGSDPSDAWKIIGIGHSMINFENVQMTYIDNITQYEIGCQVHDNCLGHLCITPSGNKLPMQSLVVSTPVIENDIYKAAKFALNSNSHYDSSQSLRILAKSLTKKTGRMRKGILNCHVDGSLRMVITPQTHYPPNVVTIPHYLKGKWSVVYFDEYTNKYRCKDVESGDNAIAIRPPALSIRSVQPVTIMFWNETCMGISPDLLKAFDGDYDGDEMHLFPVYSRDSIEECKTWQNTINSKFEYARSLYKSSSLPNKTDGMYDFMKHTTLSFEEISNGHQQPIMSEETRTKIEHLTGFKERYNTSNVSKNFVTESIRGMGDTNTQQLSQPIVGDISRIAKLAASCIVHKDDGTIYIALKSTSVPICVYPLSTQDGNPCTRAILTICAGMQQVTLEAHHAKKVELPSHNLIMDLIKGEGRTFVLLSNTLTETRIKSLIQPMWYNRQSAATYIVCEPQKLSSIKKDYILGCYRTTVLAMIPEKSRIQVCKYAITELVKYHSFALSDTEIQCLSVLYSYKNELSTSAITTRDGIVARNLRWTDTMMATHYTGFSSQIDENGIPFAPIDTASSSLMAGNFLN